VTIPRPMNHFHELTPEEYDRKEKEKDELAKVLQQ
jgi:hypothetical protein